MRVDKEAITLKITALAEWFCTLFIITMGDKANKKLCTPNGGDKKRQDITLEKI